MIIVLRVLAAVSVAILLSIGFVFLARLAHRHHQVPGTDDVEGAYISAVSTLYGIFVAFMIFIVWNQYNDSREAVASEANKIAEVYQLAGGLKAPMKTQVRSLILEYAHSLIDYEWAAMKKGELSLQTQRIVGKMWKQLNYMGPEVVTDSVIRDHLITSWSDAVDLRRLRLGWASSGLSASAYALLVVGGLITLGISCLFMTEDLLVHIIKASAMGVMIILMLVTIWGLDHPFSSNVRIMPTPLIRMVEMLNFGQTPR